MTISPVEGYEVSTDRQRLDLDAVHAFLVTAYWSPGLPRPLMERAIANSMCFGVYAADGSQAGFARVVTDSTHFAYLADVFVLPQHRGRGLGAWLVEAILTHPDLQTVRRWSLGTADAHGLYARFGFGPARRPGRMMWRESDPGW